MSEELEDGVARIGRGVAACRYCTGCPLQHGTGEVIGVAVRGLRAFPPRHGGRFARDGIRLLVAQRVAKGTRSHGSDALNERGCPGRFCQAVVLGGRGFRLLHGKVSLITGNVRRIPFVGVADGVGEGHVTDGSFKDVRRGDFRLLAGSLTGEAGGCDGVADSGLRGGLVFPLAHHVLSRKDGVGTGFFFKVEGPLTGCGFLGAALCECNGCLGLVGFGLSEVANDLSHG